ncbi:hypothetical protein ER308_02965 [Egibacter rhizosphaerae]|uniref:DoxX family membrane protein n=1 Tax=Egibacter rhizosphaerae TaxID=1670831 RepID=A0A411YBS0_9ACTN|nr:hypothetical protein [Egibacter rhizosphaerae]QBI18625.1 hypothetical protein ER308_02965 [Egibacter rhizosphaerae]
MGIGFTGWEAPLRISSGAFILQQGLSKRDMPDEAAQGLLEFAKSAEIPGIADLEPREFIDLVAIAETALGGVLLAPFVPRRLAGLGLMTFSGFLLRLYWKAPGMREEGGIAPTSDGTAMAKDAWLFAIGMALFLAGSRKKERARRQAA